MVSTVTFFWVERCIWLGFAMGMQGFFGTMHGDSEHEDHEHGVSSASQVLLWFSMLDREVPTHGAHRCPDGTWW